MLRKTQSELETQLLLFLERLLKEQELYLKKQATILRDLLRSTEELKKRIERLEREAGISPEP